MVEAQQSERRSRAFPRYRSQGTRHVTVTGPLTFATRCGPSGPRSPVAHRRRSSRGAGRRGRTRCSGERRLGSAAGSSAGCSVAPTWGSHSSHRGRYQLLSPSHTIAAIAAASSGGRSREDGGGRRGTQSPRSRRRGQESSGARRDGGAALARRCDCGRSAARHPAQFEPGRRERFASSTFRTLDLAPKKAPVVASRRPDVPRSGGWQPWCHSTASRPLRRTWALGDHHSACRPHRGSLRGRQVDPVVPSVTAWRAAHRRGRAWP